VHKSIRADLIKETAEGLAHTINTQGLPQWIIDRFGEEKLAPGAIVEWDVTPPTDRTAEASALKTTAEAMAQLTQSLATHGMRLDAKALSIAFGVPVLEGEDAATDALLFDVTLSAALDLAAAQGLRPTEDAVRKIVEAAGIELEDVPQDVAQPRRIDLAPTDIAKVVRVSEARASQGLPPMGDERDELTITEMSEGAAADAETEVVEAEADADAESAIEVDDAAAENEPVESEVA
jgi:plasmid stability protein